MKQEYQLIISNILPILLGRKKTVLAGVAAAATVALLVYASVGERYEPYTLLRVGQGIKDRSIGSAGSPLGEGVDLVSRIDSLARIVTTDHVIRLAATSVGFDRLFNEKDAPWIAKLKWRAIRTADDATDQKEASDQAAISALRDLISTKAEGKSDLLRISFRYPDPVIATEFLNALANGLVATQADLIQVPGADVFFQEQSKRLEREAERASTELEGFSVGAAIYSVSDQRQLLLKRANELTAQVATTRGLIEERRGQKQAIIDQLLVLRPVTQSRTVTGIVATLGGVESRNGSNDVGNIQKFEEAPPLLLVKVYQDAMSSLLKINSDLNGSLQLEKALGSQIEQVNAELAALSSKEAEYDRLKRMLTRASSAADHYATRMIEEQINADIAKKTQLSSVRVVQVAERMAEPIFPRPMQLALLALTGGLLFGIGIALMLELTAIRHQLELDSQLAFPQPNRGTGTVRKLQAGE